MIPQCIADSPAMVPQVQMVVTDGAWLRRHRTYSGDSGHGLFIIWNYI